VTTSITFDAFTPELLPGETIGWAGRPNPGVIFHQEDWLVIPFSLFWGGFAIFWLLGASGIWDIWVNKPDRTFQYFGLIWGTPFVLVGQYLIWGRFVYKWWQKTRLYYALTNRRALIVERGLRNRTTTSAYFEGLSIIDKSIRRNGIGSISFGGPVTAEWGRGRRYRPPRPPTFDDLDNAQSVYQIVIRLHDQARNSARSTTSPWRS
jgi:hypothetical protein